MRTISLFMLVLVEEDDVKEIVDQVINYLNPSPVLWEKDEKD